jgi:hypothetical protein
MKGFPLLNALVVAVAFVLGWWPLQRAMTGDVVPDGEAAAVSPTNALPVTMRIFATAPIGRLRVEHLGQTVIDLPKGEQGEITYEWKALELPKEGVEFWVDADLTKGPGATGRSALAIEVTPADGEARIVTLWSDENGAVADTALFIWDPSEP